MRRQAEAVREQMLLVSKSAPVVARVSSATLDARAAAEKPCERLQNYRTVR